MRAGRRARVLTVQIKESGVICEGPERIGERRSGGPGLRRRRDWPRDRTDRADGSGLWPAPRAPGRLLARLSSAEPVLHPVCEITEARFGACVDIGRGSRIAFSEIGDYSYCDRSADIANATVCNFADIARFARIGATDHPPDPASCHHVLYRAGDDWNDARRDEAFPAHRRSRRLPRERAGLAVPR